MKALVDEHKIDCSLSTPGSLYLALSEDSTSLKMNAEARIRAGFPCELIESNLLPGATRFVSALYTDADALIHPVKFLRGLAEAAEKYGASIYENTRAEEFDAGTVKTKGGVIRAKNVIVATEGLNAGATEQGTHLDYVQALVTQPLSKERLKDLEWHMGGMLWTTESTEYASVRKVEDRLFICKSLTPDPTQDEIDSNREWQRRKLQSLFPGLRKVEISHQWTCHTLDTPDDRPFIGKRDGCYEAFGLSGNGLTNGVMAGRMLAAHFLGAELPPLYRL